jgi:hypothetical protein
MQDSEQHQPPERLEGAPMRLQFGGGEGVGCVGHRMFLI